MNQGCFALQHALGSFYSYVICKQRQFHFFHISSILPHILFTLHVWFHQMALIVPYWTEAVKGDFNALFLILEGEVLSFLPLHTMLAVTFLKIIFIKLRKIASIKNGISILPACRFWKWDFNYFMRIKIFGKHCHLLILINDTVKDHNSVFGLNENLSKSMLCFS